MIIFSHLFNDFSGSSRVLCDFVNASNKPNIFLITSTQMDGFLNYTNDIKKINNSFTGLKKYKVLSIINYLFSQVKTFFIILKLTKDIKDKTEIIIVNNTVYNLGSSLAGKILGIRVVMIVHELSINKYFKFLVWNFYQKAIDDIVYVSNFLKNNLKVYGPNLHILHNGLRKDFEVQKQISTDFKFKNKNILFVGSLKAYKGIYELIEIAKSLPDFNFVAAVNCSKNQYENFIENNISLKNLKFIHRPNHQKLIDLYKDAFLLMNLSKRDAWIETFGLTILEGMFFGCPIVAPKVGGHTDYMNNSHGLLEDSENTSAIASFINNLSQNYEKYKDYSLNCQITADKFSPDNFQKNSKELLDKFYSSHII